ncbi:MAG: YafY family transcriptional regulator, partial [Clostridia bacterium]|nr:YafY family transcriptional regulator [Clostridia bacterium]
MKTERLLEIIFILLEKKVVTAKELADRFQVSQRTIYRDLIALSASGIPVYTEQGRNGGIHLIEEYALNKTLLTDTEQSQIVMALQSMRAIGQDDMSTSLSKVKGIFQRDFDDWIEIDFSGWSYSNIEQQMFQIIKESILHAQVLEFEYSSLKGETITREVEPYKLVFKGRNWYLSAFCLHKKEFRFFKLIRMRNPRIKQEKVDRTHFVIYENKKTEEYSPKM